VIREALKLPNFIDHESISKLANLQIVQHESINFQPSDMPIPKKNGSENGQQQENGIDKGIFSVSRVKKVELSEIPLATDICSTRKFSVTISQDKNEEFSHITNCFT
jgi:hypothetical protein